MITVDIVETAENVTVVLIAALCAMPPVHVMVLAEPAAMVAVPIVRVSSVVVAAVALISLAVPVTHVGTTPVKIDDDAVIVIVLVFASASVTPITKTIPVGVLPANSGFVPVSAADVQESELVVRYPVWAVISVVDFVETALNVAVVAVAGFAAKPPVQMMTGLPTPIPPAPTVIVRTSTPELRIVALPLMAVGAALMPHEVSSPEAFVQIAVDAVRVMVSPATSASVMPMVKVIADAVAPAK
jgi:hypothetical protein